MLQYGNVFLNLICIRRYEKQAVFDGPNYAYTRVTLVVDAVFNPFTQSDAWPNSPRFDANNQTGAAPFPVANAGDVYSVVGPPTPSIPGGPRNNSGVPATISEAALRHALMLPRQILQLSVGGLINLRSPIEGQAADVMGGPNPLFVNVAEVYGTRSWLVQYGISTCINDCPYYQNDAPVIISHTFEMSDTLDADYFTTRVTRGRAVFRADGMIQNNIVPDDYRSLIIPPLLLGCKRERVHIQQDQQPNIIHFETQDRELPIGWLETGVTRVKAFHTYGTHRGNREVAALKQFSHMASHTFREIGQITSRLQADLTLGAESAVGVGLGIAASTVGNAFQSAIGYMTETAPVTQHVLDVEVWGDGTSTRRSLERFARGIIQTRLIRMVGQLLAIEKGGINAVAAATLLLPPQASSIFATAINSLGVLSDLPAKALALISPLGEVVSQLPGLLSKVITTLLPGVDTSITHDLTGKYVHIQHVVSVGPLATVLTGTSEDTTNNVPILTSDLVFPPSDDTGDLLVRGATPLGPSYDGKSRGSFIGILEGTPYRSACQQPSFWAEEQPVEDELSAYSTELQDKQLGTEIGEGLTPDPAEAPEPPLDELNNPGFGGITIIEPPPTGG